MNIRTLLKAGKLEEVKMVISKSQLHILGICEKSRSSNRGFSSFTVVVLDQEERELL